MSNTSATRSAKHWPDLPEKPAWQKVICVGNYRPQGFDVHGSFANYVAGCRCSRCLHGHGRVQRRKYHGRPNFLRARRFVDPLRIAPWRAHRAGGPWLLFYAVLLPAAPDLDERPFRIPRPVGRPRKMPVA